MTMIESFVKERNEALFSLGMRSSWRTPTSTTTTAPTERCGRKLDTSSRKSHKKRVLILADKNS